MMTTYSLRGDACAVHAGPDAAGSIAGATWIDLLNPTPEEERAVQAALHVEVPTREEMQEIESSSRLYKEGEVLFLTASFLYGADEGEFGSTPITFVLAPTALVTVRYATPKAFSVFALRAQRYATPLLKTPDGVMLNLFEQIVDRLADILERTANEMDRASQTTFRNARNMQVKANKRDLDLRQALLTLGQVGDVTTRASDTLLGLTRILTFVGAEKASAVRRENQVMIKTLVRDVRSLVEYANTMNNKAQFLLDAVLGIISMDQNGIIKTFTVASVALMPPTLVASIYGMNFEYMPELKWTLGYPWALLLMVVSAVLPIVYFKRKGWL
ncbi:magnesium transporter CorA family protein [Roseomonas xinghualingensis]|uniref:magnesium transporter CorA family protein n=1 Tax=Roseomonas xinghualingensis TaxID=2986475 RepID=UPI0021F23DE4|nr:magnesium transporter CorA family protein [Roseomonas sp. SXEYE001]MCV4206119.1 magnesium transporter CorA family protein [Roseomonas sp. SXEYE001]